MSKEKLDELRAQHGDIASITTKDGKLFAFRRPSLDEFENFQTRLRAGGQEINVARRELCGICIVHPPRAKDGSAPAEMQALFESRPMAPTRISDALVEMADADIEVTVKKG